MADQKNNVVPFGKYKGQPIEALQADPDYLQWLTAQDWFRDRFANLYQIIVNHSGEPAETPEHNALQVLFLDDAFCLAFMRHLHSDFDRNAMQRVAEHIEWLKTFTSEYWRGDVRCESAKEKLRQIPNDLRVSFQFAREFEYVPRLGRPPVDVSLTVLFDVPGGPRDHWGEKGPEFVEIKPAVSDDYPAILRQMKANGSKVLLLREYTGRGATREQFVKTFATASIRVVFVDEIGTTAV